MSYADDMQAVSVDQALIDVSSTVENAGRHALAEMRHNFLIFFKELAEPFERR
jgi:hypothetical protein